MKLSDIQRPVAEHISAFEPYFRSSLKSPNTLLTLVTNHVFRRKGKQMRPLIVFLAAQACGRVDKSAYAAAALIELLHNASLVHDDVVDETYTRRGQWSVMAMWNSKVAVLVGDFFLARGMSLAIEEDQFEVLKIVSEAVRDLSEGELSQIEHARNLDVTEEVYYDIIRQKTATLIQACAKAGAAAACAPPPYAEALAAYGEALGLAFQIRDDIFDYTPGGLFGKPALNDIKEQKMTLPLLAAMERAPKDEVAHLRKMIRRQPKADATAEAALRMVQAHGGIDYAAQRIGFYAQKAKDALEALPDSPARQALADLVDFNTERKV